MKRIAPYDSWIALAPGEKVQVDARLHKEWAEKTREYRYVRGEILVAASEIEYSLDSLLTVIFLPKPVDTKEERISAFKHPILGMTQEELWAQFDQHLLKSGVLSFNQKIRLLKKVAATLPSVGKFVPEELTKQLMQVKDLRNRFAHYLVSFVVSGEPPNQTLQGTLVCRDKEIVLDDTYLKENIELVSSTRRELARTFDRLTGTRK